MTDQTSQDQPQPAVTAPEGDIVAKPGRYYRNTRYLMFVLLVGMGVWFAYDGWVSWPRENAKIDELKRAQAEATKVNDVEKLKQINTDLKNYKEHSNWDLMIQKVLATSLPPLGLGLLLWALHQSRGEYRMSGTKISIPGHPTVDLADIKSVNNDLWDRKGIAWVTYETAGGDAGEFKLDDFLYDRPPTDQIYDRIAEHMGLDEDEGEDEDDQEDDDEDAEEENNEESSSTARDERN